MGVKVPGAKRTRKPAEKKPPEQHSETCLQMHCKQWLDKAGIWSRLLIFHVANERKGGIGAIMHFKRMGVRPGVADWLAFSGERRVAVELKDDDGEQGPDQKKFQAQWEAAGGEYYLLRTVEEFQKIVTLMVKPPGFALPWA